MSPTILTLPAGHARDWWQRLGDDHDADLVAETARTVTLRLTDDALRDLIADALYYAEEMGPANTGDIDYRPRARTLLRAIEKTGIRWSCRHFSVTLETD